MICFGRNNYFRFNHPSEAERLRNILPSARISMAPISFYPAVDNPEYFHMTAQDVTFRQTATVGANPDELGSPEGTKPPVPPRKPSPSTLRLSLTDNNLAINEVNGDVSANSREQHNSEAVKCNLNDSDSDSPPEIPPRSEQSSIHYVNTSVVLSNSPNATSINSSYLGDYIYTKAEIEPNTPCVISGATCATGGAATVISPDGTTTIHNTLYCADLPQMPAGGTPLQSASYVNQNAPLILSLSETFSPSCSVSTPKSATAPSSPTDIPSPAPTSPTPNLNLVPIPRIPAPPVPISPPASKTGHQSLPVKHFEFELFESQSPTKCLEELKAAELKKQQVTAAREKEDVEAAAERERLEEILSMCAEYDRKVSSGSPPKTHQSPPYHTLTQNRIKTNGSLPRDKRSPHHAGSPPPLMGLNSPSAVPPMSPSTPNYRVGTPSEDELTSIFSFEVDPGGRTGSLTRSGSLTAAYPPFPTSNITLPVSPITARSPYENVCSPYPNYYPPVPHSPRTRIRTTFPKEKRDHCEIFENKVAICDFGTFGRISKESSSFASDLKDCYTLPSNPAQRNLRSQSRSPKQENKCLQQEPQVEKLRKSPETPTKPPRSPRIERSVLSEPLISPPSPYQEESVITNIYFAPVTPKRSVLYSRSNGTVECRAENIGKGLSPHYSSPSSIAVKSTPTNCLIDCKIKNKVFEEQMIKNIQESLNVEDVPEEIQRLKNEKVFAMAASAQLKRKIDDIECQENELLRDLDIERALLEAELAATRDTLAQDEPKLISLRLHSDNMDARHHKERKTDFDCIQCCKSRLDEAEESLERMEWKSETFKGTTDEETEMLESLKAQHETVESERKTFEDTEFSQMESEAHRECEREELNQEISELIEKVQLGKANIAEFEAQMTAMTLSVCQETESLEKEKQELIAKINKERMHLSSVERQFGELERLGVMSSNDDVDSSDTDESCTPELAEKLARLHLLDRSQDDLDLIHKVTTSSPLGYSDVSLGRKTSATLQEIEKNRQFLLAKQGTSVIDNERKRVEELKQRVAEEVKAQWEERKAREQREVNCTSLNSVGSEDSSLNSSDMQTESLSSDDVTAGLRSSGESCATKTTHQIKLRQREHEVTSDDSLRPISDASSFCDSDGVLVRFRKDKSRTQRPLTRYLPVRAEAQFDLRQHIESAGHQVDQCLHLTVTSTACRGYLCKLGSKFRTWQKRWFVFDRTKRALIYYSDKNESKPKGGSCFQDIEEVYVDHPHSVKSPMPNVTFCVKTHQRVYHFMARSPEAMRIWIDVIFTGAEGYREFQSGT